MSCVCLHTITKNVPASVQQYSTTASKEVQPWQYHLHEKKKKKKKQEDVVD
jgi:hypothetical protein